jgi:glycosyltransferase involved in cell wall biosynthesis
LKRVLVVAYQFPPVGGSGVQRTLKFVKYLPGFQWMPEVLTRRTGPMVQRDDTLMAEVPDFVSVIRTPSLDLTAWPGKLALAGKFIAWKLLVPDGEVLWMRGALRAARGRLASGDVDAVYTTSYPYSDHLAGLRLKQEFPHVPWLADFRDEWTNNPYLLDHPHPGWRMRREKAMEQSVLERADMLVTNSPGMKANFMRLYPGLDLENRMHVIPNGYDPDDFDPADAPVADPGSFAKDSTISTVNERFVLTYTGALYGRRKPDLFLEALGRLVSEGRIGKDDFRVRLMGSYKPDLIRAMSDRSGLSGSILLEGYQPHADCLRAMSASDALLLLEGGGPGAEAFFTGKVFEYIRAGRPILAVVPQNGAAAGIVRDTGTGIVCDCGDVRAIMDGFMRLHDAWKSGTPACEPKPEKIGAYDRRVLTATLAGLLSGMAGKGTAPHGTHGTSRPA